MGVSSSCIRSISAGGANKGDWAITPLREQEQRVSTQLVLRCLSKISENHGRLLSGGESSHVVK